MEILLVEMVERLTQPVGSREPWDTSGNQPVDVLEGKISQLHNSGAIGAKLVSALIEWITEPITCLLSMVARRSGRGWNFDIVAQLLGAWRDPQYTFNGDEAARRGRRGPPRELRRLVDH